MSNDASNWTMGKGWEGSGDRAGTSRATTLPGVGLTFTAEPTLTTHTGTGPIWISTPNTTSIPVTTTSVPDWTTATFTPDWTTATFTYPPKLSDFVRLTDRLVIPVERILRIEKHFSGWHFYLKQQKKPVFVEATDLHWKAKERFEL